MTIDASRNVTELIEKLAWMALIAACLFWLPGVAKWFSLLPAACMMWSLSDWT